MQRTAFHRILSLCLAACMTMAVLAGVDHLAQPASADAQMAQASAARA